MKSGHFSLAKKLFLGFLLILIAITGTLLLHSLQSTQSLEKRADYPIAGQCLIEDHFCQWDPVENIQGVIYHYKIYDKTFGETLVLSGKTEQNHVQYQPLPGHSYQCLVEATAGCRKTFTASSSLVKRCEALSRDSQSNTTQTLSNEKGAIFDPINTNTSTLSPTSKIIKIIKTVSTPSISLSEKTTPILITTVSSPTSFINNTPTPTITKSVYENLPQAGIPAFLYVVSLIGIVLIILGFCF